MNRELIIITGTYPPQICGAGDYTQKLLLTENAKKWKLFYHSNWKLKTFCKKIKEINSYNISVLNLQYPTMGYKKSFIPHLLCIYYSLFTKKIFSVTFHEFTQLSFKAKTASIIFFIFANKLIFTNRYELESAAKYIRPVKRKSTIIKIFTNIEAEKTQKKISEREYDLIYFGLIRPEKGLEDFIEAAKQLMNQLPGLKIAVIGKEQPEYKDYANVIFSMINKTGLIPLYNKSENDVSTIIANSKVAYLPFPDGISERRGSALAVLSNLCLLVTTKGRFTTKELETCCSFANNPALAQTTIKDLLINSNEAIYDAMQKKILNYIKNDIPQSWEEISNQYNSFLFQ